MSAALRTWIAAGIGLLSVLTTSCAHLYAHPLPDEARKHRVKTADGWELALVQYLPKGAPTGRPVLLQHGISANARHMDLDEKHSLARHLAAQGREAWTVSIRGTGESDRKDPSKGRVGDYSFDTLWQQDTRAAIAYVRAHAETPKLLAKHRAEGGVVPPHLEALAGAPLPEIDYVGHSMGGLLLYAYLSQGGDGVHAAVTLGSPTRLDWGGTLESTVLDASAVVFGKDAAIPGEVSAVWSMGLQGRIKDTLLERLLYNPDNTTPEAWRRLVAIGTGDMAFGVWNQVAGMTRTGRFASADGAIDYRAAMKNIRVPILVVAGKVDRIANPAAVKDAYRALGGPKAWLLAAEENGFVADYGHMDYLIGQRAHSELWPHLLAFLERQQVLSAASDTAQ